MNVTLGVFIVVGTLILGFAAFVVALTVSGGRRTFRRFGWTTTPLPPFQESDPVDDKRRDSGTNSASG